MKKLFILLLIIPILGFSQNDLVFDRVLNFRLTPGQEATVPSGKAWKIERGASGATFSLKSTNQPYGDNLNYENTGTQFGDVTSTPTWLGAGASIKGISNSGWLSILEFNVVAASSSSGSGSSSGSSGGYNGPPTGTGGDSFNDNDGNSQETTVTAGQTWSTSNASHKTYRDGTPIPHITDWTEWENATTGAWTYYLQDETLGIVMYNGHAIKGKYDNDLNTPNKQFAPEGWRVPTLSDYLYLFESYGSAIFYGGSSSTFDNTFPNTNYPNPSSIMGGTAAEAIKSQTGWAYDINGTNTSGLDFKPTGAITGENYGFSSNPTELASNTAQIPPYTQGYDYNGYSSPYAFFTFTSTTNTTYGSLHGIYLDIGTTNLAPQNIFINDGGGDESFDVNYGCTTRLIKTN